MSDVAYFIAAAMVMAGLLVSLWLSGPRHGGPFWALAWLGLFIAGGAAFVAADYTVARYAYPCLGTLVVVLLIDGTRRFCEQPAPRWLWPSGLAIALLRSGMQTVASDAVTQAVATVLMIAGTIWCTVILFRSEFAARNPVERALAPVLMLPGIAQALYAWWRATGADPANGLLTWLVAGMVVAAFQLILLVSRRNEEQRLAELRRAEAHWAHDQAEASRALAGGLAHVLNNRLQPIVGYADLLATRHRLTADEGEVIDRIRDATRRASEVTKSAIDYTSRLKPEPARVSIRELLAPLLVDSRVRIEADASCDTSLEVDIDLTRQALAQIVRNAFEAGASTVQVTSRLDGYHRQIIVTDDGRGIAEQVRDHLFEPFSTTRMPNQGAGLGLAFARNVAVAHGGYARTLPVNAGASIVLGFPALANELRGRSPEMPMYVDVPPEQRM